MKFLEHQYCVGAVCEIDVESTKNSAVRPGKVMQTSMEFEGAKHVRKVIFY